MRIGMLADAYKPHISGITIYMDTYRAALERDGHEVYIFTFGNQREAGDDEHVVRSPGLPLPQRGYYVALGYSPYARRLLQSMDLAHVHHPFTSGQIALRYCRPRGIPVVFTNHTRYDLYARSYIRLIPPALVEAFLRWYMPRFCSAIDLVISPSSGMSGVLRKMGVTSPVAIVPNGMELHGFQHAEPLRRATFGFSETDIVLVYSGRIAREKNLHFLLQAFAEVSYRHDHVRLLLIGAGPRRLLAELKHLSAKLNLGGDQVRFTGLVSYAALPAYLAMCDVFVTASVTETFGMSAVEAMAAGLPVIGIDSPGISDVVEDGATGLLSVEDVSAFADILTSLCLDARLRKRLGQAARRASASYDIRHTKQIILGHYQRLVERSRSARGLA